MVQNSLRRLVTVAVLALALGGCEERPTPNGRQTIRLSPVSTSATTLDAALLVDRDTTQAVPVRATTHVTLQFGHEVEVRRIKVHGAKALRVQVDGLDLGAPDEAGWASGTLKHPITTSSLSLAIEPDGAGAQLNEIEVLGAGKDLAPRDVSALASATAAADAPTYENAWTLRADPPGATLQPPGAGEGSPCFRARFPAADPRQARRAYLAYEANVLRGVVLQHSFNGEAPVNGIWLGSTSTVRTVVTEIDPERLRGRDDILVCLPDDAGGSVTVDGLRVLMLVDDGTSPFDRETSLRLREGIDGDPSTGTAVYAGAQEFTLERAVDVEAAELHLGRVPAHLERVGVRLEGAWREQSAVDVESSPSALQVSGKIEALRLEFAASSRPDVPAASVNEISVAGSGVGPRVGTARLVLAFPSVKLLDGRVVGERFGDRAFLAGWAESPSGRGAVEIDGARVDVDGAFSQVLRRNSAEGSWPVTLRARFPDGSEVTRTVYLDDDHESELLAGSSSTPAGTGTSADQRFGRENQTGWGTFDPELGGKVMLGTDVEIEAPPGAVGARTSIGVTRKGHEVMPHLDAGMINVTAPAHGGYRFVPKGQKFAKAVKVTLPYDPDLLPEGVAPEEVQTYYFDEEQDRWFTLPRRQVLRDRRQVVSETTHFTFMINAVLVEPDHPGPASFNPNSIKDLKAADPGAGIDLIEPPTGNAEGSARLSFPIRLPKGRGAFQPSLALTYDSTSAGSWVGYGWSLAVPHVSIDTRYGVPEYGGEERYLLDGEAIVPMGTAISGSTTTPAPAPTCLDKTVPAREYRERVQRGFRRILRCGGDPARYWFEVTDKGGVVFIYGHGENARLMSYVPRVMVPPVSPPRYDVAEWYLERVVDPNGNLTEYAYQHDSPGSELSGHREPFRQIYLRSIQYSGTASRTGAGALEGGTPGVYLVELHHDKNPRPDELTSARSGFKTVTRRRLGEIEVRLLAGSPSGLVRRYVLAYDPGDFGKSLLTKVEVRGADEKVFYAHSFQYDRNVAADGTAMLFGGPVPWVTETGKDKALTGSDSWSFGFHGFVGLGLSPSKANGTVGIGFGYGRNQSSTRVSMIDLNGDGLPDRVYDGTAPSGSAVLFNQGEGKALSKAPPAWDPGVGATNLGAVLKDHNIGKDVGNSFDASVQGFYGVGSDAVSVGGSVNIGASWALSSSNDFVLDANGDGYPDLVNGGKVLFNQPRSASCMPGSTKCCSASGFCFSDDAMTVRALEDLGDSSDLVETDPTVAQANAAMEEALTPEDAVLEWTAPYDGAVDVTGQLAFVNPLASGERRDGVRLRVYTYDPFQHVLKRERTYVKTPGDATATPVELGAVSVDPGTILYFVLSTLSDFPMHGSDGKLSPVELVSFTPVITYLGAPAHDRALPGPTGAPLYRFDATSDFVLAGDPPGAINAPREGRIAFRLKLTKPKTSDDMRVCVQYQDPPEEGEDPPPRPEACAAKASTGFVDRTTYREYTALYGSAETPTKAVIDVPALDVKAGGTLYFRVDTDVAIDPRGIELEAGGSYACVADDSGCVAPSEEDQARLTFRSVPHLPLHSEWVEPSAKAWKPSGQALVPYRVPKTGTLTIRSSAKYATRDDEIYFTVRTLNRLLFKRVGDHGIRRLDELDQEESIVEVAAGDLVFFEAHTESSDSLARKRFGTIQDVSSAPVWNLGCVFKAKDGSKTESCSGFDKFTTDGRADTWVDGNQPVLAGGFHGWRYGAWNGRNEQDFTPWVYRGPTKADADAWNKGSVDDKAANLQKEDDPQRIRLKLAGLLVPNGTGTDLQRTNPNDHGFQETGNVFVSQDGNTYFTLGDETSPEKTLRIHAGTKGESASVQEKTPDGATSSPVKFAIGKVGRSSASTSLSLNLGVDASFFKVGVSAGVALSKGLTQQKMDVLDMNGDGILDVVVASGMPSPFDGAFLSPETIASSKTRTDVRVTSPVSLATRRTLRMNGFPQLSQDVGGTVNLGVSPPQIDLTPEGEKRAVAARFPGVGGGLGFSVGSVFEQLADVNGDGLPDALRIATGDDKCPVGMGVVVHLNMGTSFAAKGDCLGLDPKAPPVDSILGKIGLAGGAALRRSSTVTLQGTAGADLLASVAKTGGGISRAEAWGLSIGGETSLTATNVALVDVTGDGLPDYVYKSNKGNDFLVRVNTGYGFTDARTWTAAQSWCVEGTCAVTPRLHLSPVATVMLSAFLEAPGLGSHDVNPGIEPLEATGSHSVLPSVSFSANFAFPIFIVAPWIHVGGGASAAPRKVAGFELGLQDIDGDGLPDQVLKTSDNAPVWARLNRLGRSNLLTHVIRPLGGAIDLAYDQRVGNTVEMPQSRWVLTSVKASDGRAVAGELGHELETTYAYEDGRHDRLEREFLGFAKVTRTNPDKTRVEQVFSNASVATKGLLVSERVLGSDDRVWVETVNAWSDHAQIAPAEACVRTTPAQLDAESYCGSSFAKLDAIEKRYYEGQPRAGIVTRQLYTYDDTGNVLTFHDVGDVADPADDLLATIVYQDDDATKGLYWISRPKSVVVTDLNGKLLRSRSATYHESGNVWTIDADIGDGRKASTELNWYANGTLEWVKGPKNEKGDRYQTIYGYDGTTGAYVTSITDSHGYHSTAEYDLRFGEAAITKDINGRVTARRFDPFGRLDRLAGPKDSLDAPTVWISYAQAAVPAYAWTHNRLPRSETDTRGSVDTVVVIDGLGRTIQTKKTAEIATSETTKGKGWSVSGHQLFDAMGRVELQGQAFGSFSARPEYVPGKPRNTSRFTYDALGRVIQTIEPNASITRVDYGFGTPAGSFTRRFEVVAADAEGHAKATYRDAANHPVAVEERIEGRKPTTTYTYSPTGEMAKVIDAAGNTTRVEYDLLGRLTKLVNPDTGELRFDLDPAGNLVRKHDPNLDAQSQSIHYVYEFDQLVKIEYPDPTRNVTYTYGTAAEADRNGIGRIVEVHDEAGIEKRTYDELGSLASSTRVLKAMPPYYREQSFQTSFTWDSFGRVMSVTYPDRETVGYRYDAGGLLESAIGHRGAGFGAPGDETYLASLMYNEFGQRVRMVLGNGVVSTYSYEPLTRRLQTLTTRTPLKRTLQAITYGYDRVGNITSMVNALGEPVGDRSGEVRYEFQYDGLYRLTLAHGEASSRSRTIDRFTARYAFSDVHNMTSNAQVHEIVHGDATVSAERPPQTNHEFAYTYDPAHPHRATKVGDTFLVNDANGNTTAECRDHGDPTCSTTADHLRRLSWTEENRLDRVIDGGGRNVTRFVYDAAGDRVVKLGRGGESITIGQFWSLKGRRTATKHVFAGAIRLASKVLPPPGWTSSPMTNTPARIVTASITESTSTNENGCVPSNYQPQKCPALPGGEPSVNHRFDDTTVRPETYYYHPDHLGSTSWVTDQNARVHEHVEYFPYGEVWRDPRSDADGAPAKGQRFLFSGKELDEETGLYYFGERYYDPVRVRWISSDPAVVEQIGRGPEFLSLYAYVEWKPTSRTDPNGAASVAYMGPRENEPIREMTSGEIAAIRFEYGLAEAERRAAEIQNTDDPLNVWYKLTHAAERVTESLAKGSVDETRSAASRTAYAVAGTVTGMLDPGMAENTAAAVGAVRSTGGRGGARNAPRAGPEPTNPITKWQLPQTGKIRYIPPKWWRPTMQLPKGPQNGFLDKFGNEWVRGSSRTVGEAFEWDVQLGRNATPGMRQLTSDGHVNVSLKGEVTH